MSEAKPLKLVPGALAALLLAAVTIWALARSPVADVAEADGGTRERSVAVLPFDNLSPDPDNAYFASGFHDELLSHLSGIRDLRVISRTTMLRYAGTQKTVREIADELGVSTVLEGSVRRVGDQVRITAQLIDAETDDHLWAETYDRRLTDILAVQSEVAREVARALEARLTTDDEQDLARRPTDDLDAYQLYLRGTDYMRRGNARDNLESALELYRRATDLDPGFAEAWAGLSSAHLDLYWYDHDPTPARLDQGRQAAERAYQLAPELPAARMAMANVYYRSRDYPRALELTLSVFEDAPSYPEVPWRVATIYRRQGRWDESTRLFDRAVELDPMNGEKLANLGVNYATLLRFPEAQESFRRSIAVAPDQGPSAYLSLGNMYLAWRGDLAAAREAVGWIPETSSDQRAAALAFYDAVEGDGATALDRLATVRGSGWLAFGPALSGPRALLEAFVQDFMGEGEDPEAKYREAAAELNDALGEEVRDPGSGRLTLTSALALSYAGLGEKERAIQTALNAVEALPVSEDATWGVDRLLALAYVYAAVGEPDLAVQTLERVLSVPTRYTPTWLGLDPFLGPLHGHPLFERLVRESAGRLRRPLVS